MEKTLDLTIPAPVTAAIEYPERDGKPMGETDFHITVILYLLAALRQFFRRVEQVYVASNMLFYFEEGDPTAVIVPDVFVVKGVAKHQRRIYKLWEERVAPCVVFEATSRSSRLEDLGTKRALYEMLGVGEYFLFDPLDEYLSPRLQGFRLVEGYYLPMALSRDGTLHSRELGLVLHPEGTLLRLTDPVSGQALPTLDEAVDLIQAEAERAQAEAQRAQAEAQRAQAEARRAQAEAERADRAEAELARLRAELERLKSER
jgi:Uma2 family endonuclease